MSFWRSKPLPGTLINPLIAKELGLVGAWIMNEGGGGKAYDGSGYNNHGTLTNMAFPPTPTSGWNPGKDGHALAFDATDDYVNCGASLNINSVNSSGITIITKFLYYGNINYSGIAARQNVNANDSSIQYRFTREGSILRWAVNASAASVTWAGVVSSLTWYTFAISHDFAGTSATLYRNGIAISSQSIQAINSYAGMIYAIGMRNYLAQPLDGIMSWQFVFNRVLYPSEIAQLYADPYCLYQKTRNVKYFVISAPPTEVYSSRGIARGILRGILR